MKKKHIIIIGSDGFLGKNLYEKLNKNKKFDVKKISRKKYQDIFKNYNWFKKINQNSTIYLLAFENDLIYFENNFDQLTSKYDQFCKNLFTYIKKKKLNPRIVFTSTVTVYGLTDKNYVTENLRENPISWYDFSKYIIERYFIFFSNIYNLDFISLRLSNVYGFSKTAQNNRGFINNIIKQSINKKTSSVNIYDKGKYLRDYIYIDDVTDALVNFANKNKFKDKIFNLCSGKSISMINVLKVIKLKLKNKNIFLKIMYLKSPKNIHLINKRNFYGNNLRLRKAIKWKPKYNLNEGIELTINKYLSK